MKAILLLLFLFNLPFFSIGQQKQAAWWFFGDSLSINFNSQPIVADTGNPQLVPGYLVFASDATISDANGNLLFYSNGLNVMNRDRKVMPNGNLYPTFQTLRSQANLIVERPNNKGQYYFFNVYGEGSGVSTGCPIPVAVIGKENKVSAFLFDVTNQ